MGNVNERRVIHMKIFTNEFEDKLVSFIGTVIMVSIALFIIGIVGGIESGLIG
jgi:hypothetical protein